jgi:hypothetical protein
MILAQTAGKIRRQMSQFSGKLSAGLSKPASRFVFEMLYGIQARQSVHLTEVGRSLEEKIPLIKTENRLSRNLKRKELRPLLQRAIMCRGAARISENTLLVLDLSDIVKPYAQKMENLAVVRDGSKDELANGYMLCQVIGVENEGVEITPMYGELYSTKARDFVSENDEIKKAIGKVGEAVEKKGVWVIDRGCDRRELYDELVPKNKGYRFIIRQKGDRHYVFGNRRVPGRALAYGCPLPYATTIVKEEKKEEKVYHLEYGFRAVRLPEHPGIPLWLVVVKGFGVEPMMLLTNVPMRKNRKALWWAISAYLTRWRIEETIRFAKQCYQIEDIRVMRYERLRNMVVLVTAAMFFASVVLGTRMKLKILASHVIDAAKRLFGIPNFRYYAISDGIKEILSRFPRRPAPPEPYNPVPFLLPLFDT